MSCLRRTVVGVMGVLLFSSNVLYAKDSPPVTNAPPETNDVADVWSQFSSAVEVPGSQHVTTNADGVLVHHFNMQPVVTNMTALTNDLPQLAQKQAALDQEMKDLPQRLNLLRDSVIQDGKVLTNISTNFVPADAEGKKIKERMDALAKEMAQLSAEYRKRLDADPEFQKAKAKLDEDLAAFKSLQERKSKLREERGSLSPKIWAINELKRRELKKQASTNEPKAVMVR